MGYTFTLPVSKKVDKEKLIHAFNTCCPPHKGLLFMSSDSSEHSYVKNNNNAIYCSYGGGLPRTHSYYLDYFLGTVATKYGLRKTCSQNKKQYPYYFYDDTITYVVPEEDKEELFSYDFEKYSIIDIETIDLYAPYKESNPDLSKENIILIYGDTELLRESCKKLIQLLDSIE